jgi:coenzyme F420-reducing hydrogenase delta subunit
LARLKRAQEILDEIGIGRERLEMFFMSGSQARTFAASVDKMTDRIRELGPNPLKGTQLPGMEHEVEDELEFRGRRIVEG